MKNSIDVILFDFDGVIVDSIPIRTDAFASIVSAFSRDKVDEFISFHKENGGMSRYLKIRYFYENILKKPVGEKVVNEKANLFSDLVRDKLSKPSYIIKETHRLLKKLRKSYKLHIISASENNELNEICSSLNLTEFFLSIHGTPPLARA